jgi:hypothetical protein
MRYLAYSVVPIILTANRNITPLVITKPAYNDIGLCDTSPTAGNVMTATTHLRRVPKLKNAWSLPPLLHTSVWCDASTANGQLYLYCDSQIYSKGQPHNGES